MEDNFLEFEDKKKKEKYVNKARYQPSHKL